MLFIEFTNDFTEIKKKVAKLGGHPVVTIEKDITKSISFRTEKEIEKVNFKVVVSVGNMKQYPFPQGDSNPREGLRWSACS